MEAVLEDDIGSWDGQVNHLDSPISVATAAVDFLLGRWLPVIEQASFVFVSAILADVGHLELQGQTLSYKG